MRRIAAAAAAVALLAGAGAADAKPKAKGAAKAQRCSLKTSFTPGGSTRAGAAAWRRRGRARAAVRRRCAAPRLNVLAAAGAADAGAAAGHVAAAPAAGSAPPPAAAPATPAAPAAAPACDPSPWLGAIAEDVGGFRLRLTRSCVPAGRVLVNFVNRDLQPHNLYAEGIAPQAAPRRILGDVDGESQADAAVQLAAGEWRIYCAIAGHEAMTKRLQVIAPA